MPPTGWMVPYGADQTVYLVVDRINRRSDAWHESEVERTDPEAIIADLLSGQFNDPVRVIAFNTLEHWSRDVSADIAAEIQTRCDIEGAAVPEHRTQLHPFGPRPTAGAPAQRCRHVTNQLAIRKIGSVVPTW
jgi:hypothetical protein